MKKIAIASGKGGTGKTSLSVSLFHQYTKERPGAAILVDCDVEEPNDLLFFDGADCFSESVVNQMVPVIDTTACTFCRKCVDYCEFNAIVVIPPVEFAEVNPSLCHSCGACSVACEWGAIREEPLPVGTIRHFQTRQGEKLSEGELKIGSAMQTMMIRELKKSIKNDGELIIYDAPPGTSCPVVETISDTDFVILVTEPTPFGLHDLKLMVDLLRELQKSFGVVINKAGLGDEKVYQYLEEEKIPLIGEIPFDRDFAAYYSSGVILDHLPTSIQSAHKTIINNVNQALADH